MAQSVRPVGKQCQMSIRGVLEKPLRIRCLQVLVGHRRALSACQNGDMSMTLHVPEDLASRLAAEAGRRGLSVDDLSAQLLAAGLPPEDPLEAFIGSGRSGRGDLGRRHREILAEHLGARAPRDR